MVVITVATVIIAIARAIIDMETGKTKQIVLKI